MSELLKSGVEEIQIIAFNLGEEEYTVPITCVQEIIMPQKTTHIPKSPAFVEGVINLRGKIIPILDGRTRFGIKSASINKNESRIIVLELETHTVGLIVDSVSEVIHIKASDIEPTPIETEDENKFIMGIGKVKNRLLIMLDPSRLLSTTEVQSISSLTQIAKNITDTMKLTEEVKSR